MIGLVSGIEALTSAVAGPGGTTSTSSVRASFPVGGTAQASGPASSDFGQMLAQVASEAVNSLKAGEQAAISGVQGKASVQQVVEALMSAERSLQTAIAVRDKVTSAYLEISRMAI
jgi:flagellar hook-basal body complex protein FliE